MFVIRLSLVIVGMFSSAAFSETPPPVAPMENQVTQGALRVKINDEVIECPLKHTDVKVTLGPDPLGTGWSSDTTRVPDASRITPPVLKPGYRRGDNNGQVLIVVNRLAASQSIW